MTTINVNLKPCDMWCQSGPINARPASGHWGRCAAVPILIPCPIPRSVEMMVRLGECACLKSHFPNLVNHSAECPARPIRVTCSIDGETWAESEVVECVAPEVPLNIPLLAICRERWEIVKALVTGWTVQRDDEVNHGLRDLCTQRDAVFAALAKMAKAEDMQEAALREYLAVGLPDDGLDDPPRQSTAILAAYVSHLIAKVGAL